jgi:hypothetical protein
LAAGGKVGGFSAPGGSASKIRMLALEGFTSSQRQRRSNLSGFRVAVPPGELPMNPACCFVPAAAAAVA